MFDGLRNVQNVQLVLPNLTTSSSRNDAGPWLTEHAVETYLKDARWLVHILNVSPTLKKVYIFISGIDPTWTALDLPAEERKRRFKIFMSSFEQLNNVEIEVLTRRDWELNGGMNIGDFAMVDHVKDLQRLARAIHGQQMIDKFCVSRQVDTSVQRTSRLGESKKLVVGIVSFWKLQKMTATNLSKVRAGNNRSCQMSGLGTRASRREE